MYNARVMENAHLLRLMGIDRWRLRPNAAPLADPRAPETRAPEQTAGAAGAASAYSPATDRQPVARPVPGIDTAIARRPQPVAEHREVAPFTAVCLVVGTAMLVAELPDRRLPGKFLSDLLAVISGGAPAVPGQVVFNWPQPGVEPGTGHAGRALAAFLDKQLEDAAPRRLLVCESTCHRVPDFRWPDGTVVMPELARVVADGALKQALWERLQRADPGGSRSEATRS